MADVEIPPLLALPCRSPVIKESPFEEHVDALLADLQNTISPTGGNSPVGGAQVGAAAAPSSQAHVNGVVHASSSPPPVNSFNHHINHHNNHHHYPNHHNGHDVYRQEHREEHRSEQRSNGPKMGSLNNNLSELDTLLQDLNDARYTSVFKDDEMSESSESSKTVKSSKTVESSSKIESSTNIENSSVVQNESSSVVQNESSSVVQNESLSVIQSESSSSCIQSESSSSVVESSSVGGSELIFHAQVEAPKYKVFLPETPPPPTETHEEEPQTNGTMNGTRPTVDSLLDELNSVDTSERVEIISSSVRREIITPPEEPPARPPLPTSASASTATKELDDLMASLSDFKINASSLQTQVDSAYAKPQKPVKSPSPPTPLPEPSPSPPPKEPTPSPPPANELDSMLGNLSSHMTEQGINTTQKGCCCACDKPIVGQVITALGKTWHPEHFTCAHCNQELGTKNFFERDGKPYCEVDYHNLFSPRCAYCNGPILDPKKCVTALDQTWHPEHFFCTQCGNTFGEEGFHEKDGKPYCKEDYFNMFAPKCGGCNSPIMDNYISALNAQWHPECFVCRDCKESMQKKQYYDVDGKPVCPGCMGVSEDEEGDE